MKIEELDKNFASQSFEEENMVFYDVRKEPFKLYGLYKPEDGTPFCRMAKDTAKKVSPGVEVLNLNTSGGRVRFKTSSDSVAIRVQMPPVSIMPHMPLTGQAGFSLYFNKNGKSTYYRTFKPEPSCINGEGYTALLEFLDVPKEDIRDITIYFPLYAEVTNVFVGIKKGERLEEADSYKRELPIVFYGSSITQGGCASHPGNSYQGFISRRFDTDFVNLGFSGNAKAEKAMAEYVASLPMSVFVYDYDHNTPSVEHLKETHEAMYRIVRKKNPDIPVIFLSAPNLDANKEIYSLRRAVVLETYIKALRAGENVYYIDGERLFGGDCRDACTVDACHPNDLGFYRMADAIGATLEIIFANEK